MLIELGTLRDYWKNVSDWVKGTDVVSSPKVTVSTALPSGTNNIGDVDVLSCALPTGASTEATLLSIKDTSGIKKITDALPSGSNLIGKVGIDQTTPGTTNGVSIVGNLPNQTLVEQKTQENAVGGVLTFSANITCVEIYNTDAINNGTFTVNGLTIVVPATKSFMSPIGGTPSSTITVAGATTYIVNRYI